MSIAAESTSPNQTTASASHGADDGRLLGVVRTLIEFGRDLATTPRQCNAQTPPLTVTRRFGCLKLALIIARVSRGLMLAAASERRLPHPRLRSANPVRRRVTAPPRASEAPQRPPINEEAEPLGDLHSARDIAARIRGRLIKAEPAEICRDLGIDGEHTLWRRFMAPSPGAVAPS